MSPLPHQVLARGVWTHAEARGAGWTQQQIHAAVRSGEWVSLHRTVYVSRAEEPTALLRARAAHLAAGTGTVSGALAAQLHGIPLHGVDDLPAITLPLRVHRAQPKTMRYRWADLSDADRTDVDRVPVTSAMRTLQDLVAYEQSLSGMWALDQALRRGTVTREQLEQCEARASARWRDAVSRADPASDSPLETAGRVDLLAAGLPVQSQYRVEDPDGGFFLVDLLVPAAPDRAPVAVEADGAGVHGLPEAVFRDRRKQHVLQARSLRVVRYTWRDVGAPGWLANLVMRVARRAA